MVAGLEASSLLSVVLKIMEFHPKKVCLNFKLHIWLNTLMYLCQTLHLFKS